MRWIIVDGIDGSGKNTVAIWIAECYQAMNIPVQVVAHPSEGRWGKISKRALQSRGRAMHVVATICYIGDILTSVAHLKSKYGSGETIIFVRYLMGAAYLPRSMMWTGYRFFAKILPFAPCRLLVDVRPEVALARIQSRTDAREMFETLEGLAKAREKVLELARDDWLILDNNGQDREAKQALERIIAQWEERGLSTFPSQGKG